MTRDDQIARLESDRGPWDMIVVGGGATGAGIAVDAASRGYRTLLLEQSDFGKGTSSRSTKLVHGGVRYLQQGNISLVMEALKERGILARLAPHLVHDLAFVVPNYEWWEAPFYGLGMKVYDLLAGRYGFGPSRLLSAAETIEALPTIRRDGLRGGVRYHDGQFDDARLLINLIQTATEQGATCLNYVRVARLLKSPSGEVSGVVAVDLESGHEHQVHAHVVINATGPFVDALRLDDDLRATPIISPSQGIHLVLPGHFLPGRSAIMVPHTPDGRVMFAIPWHGHVVVGTTDVAVPTAELEPIPTNREIDFILETAADYLARPATRADVLSTFAGIRPLVRAGSGSSTAALSRDHHIEISRSGLLTICGGKWTTYRRMAEDAVDQAATLAGLDDRPCITTSLPIHGAGSSPSETPRLALYGTDASSILALERDHPDLATPLHPALAYTGAQVVHAARAEMARTVDDILARRTRALILNAQAALDMAPAVAAILATELGRDEAWQRQQIEAFQSVAQHYLVPE